MRRLSAAIVSLGLLLVACGGSNPAKNPQLAATGSTASTSTTTTTVVFTTVASTIAPNAAASPTSAPTPSEKAPCSPNGTSLKVTAIGVAFDAKCLAAPADQAFTIAFDNKDPAVPHNVAIFSADPTSHPDAKVLFRGDVITGPASTTYHVNGLPAGQDFFHCDVHPTTMVGTFIVK